MALLVEVSDRTHPKNSGPKRRGYARRGLPAYWIVDVKRRPVELHAMGAQALAPTGTFGEGREIPIVLDGREHGIAATIDLFP